MRKYFITAVCALTMLLACCLVPERASGLAGTWVLHAGGSMTCEILHFDIDGTGEGYSLLDDYEEVWLRGDPVPDELLTNQRSFQWRITGEGDSQLQINFVDGQTQSFDLAYEEDLDGTGLPGICLSDDLCGGGWVRALLEK